MVVVPEPLEHPEDFLEPDFTAFQVGLVVEYDGADVHGCTVALHLHKGVVQLGQLLHGHLLNMLRTGSQLHEGFLPRNPLC